MLLAHFKRTIDITYSAGEVTRPSVAFDWSKVVSTLQVNKSNAVDWEFLQYQCESTYHLALRDTKGVPKGDEVDWPCRAVIDGVETFRETSERKPFLTCLSRNGS